MHLSWSSSIAQLGFETIFSIGTMELLRKARVITALKTPYRENGKFDLDAYDRLVSYQIENGVDGLIVGGTTGEGQLMSWDEHVMLIAHTAANFGEKILVIGNTGMFGIFCFINITVHKDFAFRLQGTISGQV